MLSVLVSYACHPSTLQIEWLKPRIVIHDSSGGWGVQGPGAGGSGSLHLAVLVCDCSSAYEHGENESPLPSVLLQQNSSLTIMKAFAL